MELLVRRCKHMAHEGSHSHSAKKGTVSRSMGKGVARVSDTGLEIRERILGEN